MIIVYQQGCDAKMWEGGSCISEYNVSQFLRVAVLSLNA